MRSNHEVRELPLREAGFLSLFVEEVANLAQACHALRNLLDARSDPERDRLVREIADLEHRGDDLTHAIRRQRSLEGATPNDREDIGILASAVDDILDHIKRAASAVQLYQIKEFAPAVRELAEIAQRCVAQLEIAIPLLRNPGETEGIWELCVRVKAFESQADQAFHHGLARLFQEEKDPVELIKQKELLATLEIVTARCEDAVAVLGNVLIKRG